MKIVYMGTPDFSVEPLKRLLEIKGVEILAVVCNNDKPFGRKQILTPPPVKVLALEKGLKVLQYDKIRIQGVEDLKKLNPDVIVTCAFGQILSQEIIDIPKYGVLNIHASLLPKYRGASPIHYAVLNGEKQTGITIMKTDIGIDTGDIIYQRVVEIGEEETTGELFDRLSIVGAECIEKVITDLLLGKQLQLIKQDEDRATLTKMIKKEQAEIDFNVDAKTVVNQIRAFNPAPVAYTFYKGEKFKIYSASVSDKKGNVGEVLSNNKEIIVGCKNGSISLKTVQKSGGKAMDIKSFLLGNKIEVGERFGL